MVKNIRSLRKFSGVGSSTRGTCYSALGPSLGCHSQEPFGHAQGRLRDEESAFDFRFLIERVRKKRKADASRSLP